jgi:hypothetical protein
MEPARIAAYLTSWYTYMLHTIREQVCDSLLSVGHYSRIQTSRPPKFSKFRRHKTESRIMQGFLGLDIHFINHF